MQGCADRAARISGRWLNVDIPEWRFPDDASIRRAIIRHPAGQTELVQVCLFRQLTDQAQQEFFRNPLDAGRDVGVALTLFA